MRCTRIVSQDRWDDLKVSWRVVRRIEVLFWWDVGVDARRKTCPVVDVWRRSMSLPKAG